MSKTEMYLFACIVGSMVAEYDQWRTLGAAYFAIWNIMVSSTSPS